jgi:hypothetical protein
MSNGLGDTISNVTAFFGLDKVADAVAKLVGAEGCGCKERAEYLNQLFPYESYKRVFRVTDDFIILGTEYSKDSIVEITRYHPLFSSVIQLVKDGRLEEL